MFPYQVEPPRPPGPSTGLEVLAIIQIISARSVLLAAPVGIVLAFVNAASKDPVQRRLHELMWEGPVGAWSYAAQAFALVFGIALLAGGIGVVRGKRWGARRASSTRSERSSRSSSRKRCSPSRSTRSSST